MIESLVLAIAEHPKRKIIVITLTLVTAVVFALPAVEEYSAAQSRMAKAREKLEEVSGTAANLPQLTQTLNRKKQELRAFELKAVTEKDVEHLRDELQKLIREAGCEMREVNIDELPMKRSWMSNDSPLRGAPIGDPGQETPFVLAQWNARLRIEGPMVSVYKFLARVNEMDRFIQTRQVDMQRSEANESLTQLKLEVTLYDLARKTAGKGGA